MRLYITLSSVIEKHETMFVDFVIYIHIINYGVYIYSMLKYIFLMKAYIRHK